MAKYMNERMHTCMDKVCVPQCNKLVDYFILQGRQTMAESMNEGMNAHMHGHTEGWGGACSAHWDLERPLELVEETGHVRAPIDQACRKSSNYTSVSQQHRSVTNCTSVSTAYTKGSTAQSAFDPLQCQAPSSTLTMRAL